MIDRPTLVIHTTFFAPRQKADSDSERGPACTLGGDLYDLLTRPRRDPLAWGPGIPVRVGTWPERIDRTEARHAVIVPVLGGRAFSDQEARESALAFMERWRQAGARVLPVPTSANWRALVPARMPLPLLTMLAGGEDPRRATVNEILLAVARELAGDDGYASRLFISHARDDSEATGQAAEKIRAYVTGGTTGSVFFDKVSLIAGEDLTSQLDQQAEKGVFLAVRGDLYSSRSWCRRELLRAKQRRLPTLTVEVLSLGESRSAAYAGNGPTAVWDRTLQQPAAPIVTRAMVEAVRHLFFLNDSARIVGAAGLPPSAERLSRPPELLDLAAVRTKTDAAVVLLHPDPPLPAFEREILTESDKRLRLVTPTTAFAGVIGSSIRAPLDGWPVGLSLANPSEAPDAADPDGVTSNHLVDATMFLSRALIGLGASIAYGGDFRRNGFTRLLAQMVVNYNETARSPADFLHGYLPAHVDPPDVSDLVFTSHSLRDIPEALLSAPPLGTPTSPWRAALYLSDLRRAMASIARARVTIGGASIPRSHDLNGYIGRFPGVAEEVWWTLKLGRPLYLVGGFGGAAGLLVDAILGDQLPPQLDDVTWAGNPERDRFLSAFADDHDTQKLGLPPDMATLANDIRNQMWTHLGSSHDVPGWNGLTAGENQDLFRTKDPLTLTALILKGLLTLSTRDAQGKLRIEIVEGSVTEATGLELLVFPAFTNLTLDGAGAELDRVSAGAATRAHTTPNPVPAGSTTLGVDFLYAADLGQMSTAMRDISGSVKRAAGVTAEVIRRHGFRRTGVVTFLGNVAANLAEVVNGMVSGLRHAAETTEIIWFEREPVRAALLASILAEHPAVVVSRRVLPAPQVTAPKPRARRTVIAVRRDEDTLDVALLLDKSNGLAPVIRSTFSDNDRAGLAGASAQAAPNDAELARRGAGVTQLLFGAEASDILEAVGGSQVVLIHDTFASAIPYEAMTWTVGGRRLTPAREGGVVRHLLTPGIAPGRALTRPPRTGRLGVLVVINPTGNLPGADKEGDALLEALKDGPFDVSTLRGGRATVEAVKQAIADPKIDVFHYCGHAFFKGPGPRDSGLVCAGGEHLTLEDMRDVRVVPRLAFVNACQAGRVREKPADVREPQAFAEFFLQAGVDAYLGTFWLVSDDGAATFAAKVYGALAAGRELGEAVVQGRRSLAEAGNNDWANYVLYGDVGFTFVQEQSPSASGGQPGDQPPPATMVRVDDRTVVAAWSFDAADAPASFALAAVDTQASASVAVEAPARIERRDSWSGSRGVVTWIATLRLKDPIANEIELRPSFGDRLRLPAVAGTTRQTGTRGSAPRPELVELRALMEQQPDGGHEILRALQPSADPRELKAAIEATIEAARGPQTRAIWPFQALSAPPVNERALAEFCEANRIAPVSIDQAKTTTFQTKEDWFNYLKAPGAIGFTRGDDVLAPVWRALKDPARELTYSVHQSEAEPVFKAALFSDNANGLHASLAIAQQIRRSGLPYAFHLGDVYYSGTPGEFHDYFERPMEEMLDRTELFMIAGNHEMFAKGEWFQKMVRDKARAHPARQRQSAEMFRLAGPGFQILGVDTMFVGWNSGNLRIHDRADRAVLDVVESWLKERPNDLTILLTTNEPWDKGSKSLTPLYESLRSTIAGRVDLWFWGNVHYGALYEPWHFEDTGSPKRQLVGSCIGHGGYPFYTQNQIGDLPLGLNCRWLETKSRFWPDARIRPDAGANGWCRLELQRAGTTWKVVLTYIDWVGRDRLVATLAREDGGSLAFVDVQESDAAGVGAPPSWRAVPENHG